MKASHSLLISLATAAGALFVSSCVPQSGGMRTGSALGSGHGDVDFQEDIRPLLERKCLECHNSRINHGGLILETRALAFRPRRPGGPVIVPGNPEASPLYTVIHLPEELSNAMPPTRHRLSREDVQMVHDWIKADADWPSGEEGKLYPPAEKYPYPPDSHPALRG